MDAATWGAGAYAISTIDKGDLIGGEPLCLLP